MTFGQLLTQYRERANLTNQELAELADVPCSLIGGLQGGSRVIGEYQARKIGVALGLHDDALDDFILRAINNCSEKVLKKASEYPASLINFLPIELRTQGILPEHVENYDVQHDNGLALYLHDGRKAEIKTTVTYA